MPSNNKYKSDNEIEIRAILTKRHYNLLVSGQASLEIPKGVTMRNKAGSRILQFVCDDKEVSEILCEGLESSGISWD